MQLITFQDRRVLTKLRTLQVHKPYVQGKTMMIAYYKDVDIFRCWPVWCVSTKNLLGRDLVNYDSDIEDITKMISKVTEMSEKEFNNRSILVMEVPDNIVKNSKHYDCNFIKIIKEIRPGFVQTYLWR